jgi:hypothetical protein
MRGISVVAIVVGGVADTVLSALLGIPFVIYIIASRGLSHVPKDQLQSAVLAAIHSEPTLRLTQLAIGFGCSVLGGFIAASIAKERRLLNGVLASWLCLGMGIYSAARGTSGETPTIHAAMIAVTPLCYLFGAWLKTPSSSKANWVPN